MTFTVGPLLERDSTYVTDLNMSQLRLMNSDIPWLILIPRISGVVEITDLTNDEYRLLNAEVRLVAKLSQVLFEPYKLNIATIGNFIKQLHYHVISRYENDRYFPNTVWGNELIPCDPEQFTLRIENIKGLLGHK